MSNMPGGGQERESNTVKPISVSSNLSAPVSAPTSSKTSRRESSKFKADEARATSFGNDPDALYNSLSTIRTRRIKKGVGREATYTDQQYRGLGNKAQRRFDKAKSDFNSRTARNIDVQTQERSAGGGGGFQTSGDFGGGGIQIATVKPLGG